MNFPNIPQLTDMDRIVNIVKESDLDISNYVRLVTMIDDSKEFMLWLTRKLQERFSDDINGLYYDLESLIRARDYLANQTAEAIALYRSCKSLFKPSSGTALDKELEVDRLAAPYKYYSEALEQRIKTLDNKCTAAKQQQKILEEAIKRNLIA